jgi:hypothetical protein
LSDKNGYATGGKRKRVTRNSLEPSAAGIFDNLGTYKKLRNTVAPWKLVGSFAGLGTRKSLRTGDVPIHRGNG